MAAMKIVAESCERNKEPILAVLREVFAKATTVLEIGSGSGQHAVYFAKHLPHLRWLPSDLAENHESIRSWIAESNLSNVADPVELNVSSYSWPVDRIDAAFSANTAHIISWAEVQSMMAGLGRVLWRGGVFCLYGPFSYGGRHTAESNADFDAWLRSRDPYSGIRDVIELERVAAVCRLRLADDRPMPANNRILIWERM